MDTRENNHKPNSRAMGSWAKWEGGEKHNVMYFLFLGS